jgi:hypothetical protein
MKVVQGSLEEEIAEIVEQRAREESRSISSLVRMLIKKGLEVEKNAKSKCV